MKVAIAMLKNLKKYAAMKNILFIINYKTCEHNFLVQENIFLKDAINATENILS